MASPQLPATMENLPDEVLTNIFIRLLAKQLAQMRCVAKSWNALLSHSSFVKSHLHRSIHNNPEILMVFYERFSFDCRPFTMHLSRSPQRKLKSFIKLPVNPQTKNTTGSTVIGSVNGLICFKYGSRDDSVVYIWNPSLSLVLTLPRYSMPSHCNDLIEVLFRFGYDPKTDDYKVVKLTSLLRPPSPKPNLVPAGTMSYVVKEWLQIEVCSMRKGCWELISQRVPSHVTRIFDQNEVCVDGHDGHLHWLGFNNDGEGMRTIVAFDLSSETLCEIPIPDAIQDYNRYNRAIVLGVLDGKLCLIAGVCVMCEDDECEVWVMDEYGVAESWVKHHVLSKFSFLINPYGFTLRSEFLFEGYEVYRSEDDETVLLLYDPVAAKVKTLNTFPELCRNTKIVVYIDSLVWVAPVDSETSSCSITQLQI